MKPYYQDDAMAETEAARDTDPGEDDDWKWWDPILIWNAYVAAKRMAREVLF